MTRVLMTDSFEKLPDALANKVGDELVFLEVKSGTYFGLDAVGRRAWELAAEGATLGEIHATMLGEYEVEETTLERDLLALFDDLVGRGLLRIRDLK